MEAFNFWDLRFRIFRLFGATVCVHVTLVIYLVTLLALSGPNIAWRLALVALVFLSVLCHEFGHVFAARLCGGYSDVVVLWPLGGFAETMIPHTPRAHVLTAAAGPLVNGVIAAGCYLGLNQLGGRLPAMATTVLSYLALTNVIMVVFNLIPAYPMDGGKILQALLWRRLGYARAIRTAAMAGMILCVAGLVFLMVYPWGGLSFVIMTAFLLIWLFVNALQAYRSHAAPGYDLLAPPDVPEDPAVRENEEEEQRTKVFISEDVDPILDKISRHGMQSLSAQEKKVLEKASKKLSR